MNRLKMDISIDEEVAGVKIINKEDDNTLFDDILDTGKALSAISQVYSKTETPFLPGQHGILKYLKDRQQEYFVYAEPPREITLKYFLDTGCTPDYPIRDNDTDEEPYDFYDEIDKEIEYGDDGDSYISFKTVIPSMLWFVALTQRDGRYYFAKSKVYSVKDSLINPKTTDVYLAPVSNVYNDTQNVCWGNNAISIPTALSIQGLPSTFFNSPFNQDLDGNRVERISVDNVYGKSAFLLHYKIDKYHNTDSFEEKLGLVHREMIPHGKLEDLFYNFIEEAR